MKKKMALALAAMMMTGALTACGGDKPAADGSDASASGASGETLVMATNATFPPYEYYEAAIVVI